MSAVYLHRLADNTTMRRDTLVVAVLDRAATNLPVCISRFVGVFFGVIQMTRKLEFAKKHFRSL